MLFSNFKSSKLLYIATYSALSVVGERNEQDA